VNGVNEGSEELALPVLRGPNIPRSDRDRAGAFWDFSAMVSSTTVFTASDRAGAFCPVFGVASVVLVASDPAEAFPTRPLSNSDFSHYEKRVS
jgi:hypothetical protein